MVNCNLNKQKPFYKSMYRVLAKNGFQILFGSRKTEPLAKEFDERKRYIASPTHSNERNTKHPLCLFWMQPFPTVNSVKRNKFIAQMLGSTY